VLANWDKYEDPKEAVAAARAPASWTFEKGG
jgi:hypothetical protein